MAITTVIFEFKGMSLKAKFNYDQFGNIDYWQSLEAMSNQGACEWVDAMFLLSSYLIDDLEEAVAMQADANDQIESDHIRAWEYETRDEYRIAA